MRRPQTSEEKRSHQHYVGLDVSVKETSVCIVDKAGKVIREVNAAASHDDRPGSAGDFSDQLGCARPW